MSIKIKPDEMRQPLCELTHSCKFGMPIDLVRMMIPNLALGHDAKGVVWKGTIWECIDDGANVINYPGVGIDIRVTAGGLCEATTHPVYGMALVSQWVKEQMEMPHIVAIGKKMRPAGVMRSVA